MSNHLKPDSLFNCLFTKQMNTEILMHIKQTEGGTKYITWKPHEHMYYVFQFDKASNKESKVKYNDLCLAVEKFESIG